MENPNNTAVAQGAETKERTFTMTFTELEDLAKNKEWMKNFKETAEKMPILTTKQLLKVTEPKK